MFVDFCTSLWLFMISGKSDSLWLSSSPAGANGKGGVVSVNYDDFISDVSLGDELLVDGGIMSFKVTGKSDTDVEVGNPRWALAACTGSTL